MPQGYYRRPTTKERLLKKLRITTSGCWEWTGRLDKDGYGKIRFEGQDVSVSRVMWIVCNGPIPKGKQVCHTCDNPPCFNPEHLFLGTCLDNALDSVRKGRKVGVNAGESNGQSKLTEAQVLWIRGEYAKGTPQKQIADKTSMSKVAIHQIVKVKTWKHLREIL